VRRSDQAQILLIYAWILRLIYVWVTLLSVSKHPGLCKAALRPGWCC